MAVDEAACLISSGVHVTVGGASGPPGSPSADRGGFNVASPLAIGITLMTMIFAGGHVSGGHYNPAVTVAATIRGASPVGNLAPYVAAQVLAATAAALVVRVVKGDAMVERR